MKVIRIFFLVILLLVLVIAMALGALFYFIDPNQLKPVIVAEVMKETGYQLTIDGNLSWSFYPTIGVKIDRMTLNEPKAAPFIELRGVRIATEVNQLVHGNQKMRGDLFVDDIHFAGLHAQSARIGVHWQDNVLTLQPITAALYDGTFNGLAHGKNLATEMHWDWDILLSHVQLQPLLQDLNGDDTKIKLSGVGQVKMIAATQGQTRDDILKHLNGNIEYNINNGAVDGVDLNYLIQTADALINHKPMPTIVNTNQTAFDSFVGSATLTDGIAETMNTLLTATTFRASATGTINLIFQAINLQLQLSPPNAKWQVPVLMTGSLRHPDARLDMTELQKLVVKEELVKVKEKVKEEIKEHVHGKTGEFLQNLLGK